MSWNPFLNREVSLFKGKPFFVFCLILIGLSFVFYGSTLKNGYNLDDHFVYTENPKALNGLADVSEIFKRNSFEGRNYNFGYRPITVLSFAIENELFGLSPSVSHFINVLLYGLLLVAFTLFLKTLFPTQKSVWLQLCCLVFLAMPVHSEMVNNVKSRDELLMLLFGMIAAYSFLKANGKQYVWVIIGIISLSLSILAKKSGIVFLGIIPVSLFFQKEVSLKKGVVLSLLSTLPILVFRLIKKFIKESKGEVHLRSTNLIENPLYDQSIEVDRFSFSIETLGFYFKQLSLPTDLVSYYGFNTINYQGFGISQIATLIIGVFLIYLALKGLKARKVSSYAIIILFGALLPFLNLLFPMVGIVADRFAGLATIGASILISTAIIYLGKTLFKQKAMPFIIVIALVFSGYSFVLVQERNQEWATEEKLFEADVLKEPESATLHALLGKKYLYKIPTTINAQQQRILTQKAEFHLGKSNQIAPDKVILTELGNLEFRAKLNLDQAEKYYEQALRMDSTYSEPHYHMGWVALQKNNKQAAEQHFKRAINLKPTYEEAYEPLVRVLAEKGQFDEALNWNNKGKKNLPKSSKLILNEANINFLKGDLNQAKQGYQAYLKLVPNDLAIRKKLNSIP